MKYSATVVARCVCVCVCVRAKRSLHYLTYHLTEADSLQADSTSLSNHLD